jgi:hypothetical protein
MKIKFVKISSDFFKISEKGKTFKGYTLNERNLDSSQWCLYLETIYMTGNRYQTLVELFSPKGFVTTVPMKEIRLLKLKK